MWLLAQNISNTKAEDAATIRESLQTTIRDLIVFSAIFCLICALFLTSSWPGTRIIGLMAGILAVGLVFAAANTLIKRHFLSGLIVWMADIVLVILVSSWLMQKPGLVLLSAILPLIAVIAVSGWAGLATEIIVIALVWGVSLAPFGDPLTVDIAALTIGMGAFCGVLGWTASRELFKVAEWSMASFDIARKDLEEVQDRQLELVQVQEDLTLANSELSRLSQRLKALERIAEEARQATTEFVANVSHELRTPLNMIIGYADLISKAVIVPDDRHHGHPAQCAAPVDAGQRRARPEPGGGRTDGH
jgi:signal transduction histidine kinase